MKFKTFKESITEARKHHEEIILKESRNELVSSSDWANYCFSDGEDVSTASAARIQANTLRFAAHLVQQNNLNFQCVDATVQQLEKKAEELWPNKTK